MSTTFSGLITKIKRSVDNENADTDPFLKEALVRVLRSMSRIPVDFMEATTTFVTVAGQTDYTTATAGFPKDLLQWHAVQVTIAEDSDLSRPILQIPIQEMRLRQGAAFVTTTNVPQMFSWHHNRMILFPAPPVDLTITVDYLRDGTRDEGTGDLITADSTSHTNPWFDRGETALLHGVLMEYYASLAKDEGAYAFHEAQYERERKVLESEQISRQFSGGQAPDLFSDGVDFGMWEYP